MFLQEGTTNSTMDGKGRFQLPTTILREIPAELEGRFVINRSSEKCLTLYPINVWNRYKEKLNRLNSFKPEVRRAVRYFMGSASEVRLDSKNRLLIPQPLQEYACLEKDLLITTLNTFVEIWNPRLYNEDLNDFSETKPDIINEIADEIYENGKFLEDLS
ncbi:MAG: division/cell wall cluster transcriptional repressor MraZ [Lentimicrobiaceae bacterium]|nr:division/cell wall cluster transcriptional repressor MraZ [Lentimicrobiaceae bacterium]